MPAERVLRWRAILDPTTFLIGLGLLGFTSYYWPRFLVFIALALGFVGIIAVSQRRWEIAVPIQTFLLGTWAYNFFEGRASAIVGIMFVFAVLLSYAFYRLMDQPRPRDMTLVHWLYLAIATLVVWELAVLVGLFWPVEPWSRTFLVVAAVVLFERALHLRLSHHPDPKRLLAPLLIVLLVALIVILSTPIPSL